jgi:Dor1-like family
LKYTIQRSTAKLHTNSKFLSFFTENLEDDPNLSQYLYKLGTYKVDQLKKEQSRLADENKQVVEQTQDLAISNYKTFIQTSECSRVSSLSAFREEF